MKMNLKLTCFQSH